MKLGLLPESWRQRGQAGQSSQAGQRTGIGRHEGRRRPGGAGGTRSRRQARRQAEKVPWAHPGRQLLAVMLANVVQLPVGAQELRGHAMQQAAQVHEVQPETLRRIVGRAKGLAAAVKVECLEGVGCRGGGREGAAATQPPSEPARRTLPQRAP